MLHILPARDAIKRSRSTAKRIQKQTNFSNLKNAKVITYYDMRKIQESQR